MKRREFLKNISFGAATLAISGSAYGAKTLFSNKAANIQITPQNNKPNIILCMTDDQGWGDTGYNGHPVLKTPNLDRMSKEGIRFDRWYSAAPVCSPTRGSCLTGRHPYRYGVFSANVGHMPKEEITLAEALKTQGYTTGHFGKWHLGTLTTKLKDGRRGGRKNEHYSPPWENGFDECFSTEQAIPTWNPMENQSRETRYWIGEDKYATQNLKGDDSRVIMDRVIPFIRKAAKQNTPFLAVVWFHTPHARVVAGPEYRKMYADRTENEQHYFGCITAMDEQVGRLRGELDKLAIAENTMLWFSSDNGPEGTKGKRKRHQGSTGGFRGRKRSLFEGGVRVPGMLIWPAKIGKPRVVKMPCCTSDYFPTILDIFGFKMKGRPKPIDGVSLLGLIEGKMTERPQPIGFESGKQISLTDNRYKLISIDKGGTYMLFDLIEDPYEKKNIANEKPEIVKQMKKTLNKWRASCKLSLDGKDYK